MLVVHLEGEQLAEANAVTQAGGCPAPQVRAVPSRDRLQGPPGMAETAPCPPGTIGANLGLQKGKWETQHLTEDPTNTVFQRGSLHATCRAGYAGSKQEAAAQQTGFLAQFPFLSFLLV